MSYIVTDPSKTYLGGTAGITINGANYQNSVLDGSAGNDVLIAGSKNEILIGGLGDTLTAGSAHDTFLFLPNFGDNTITNFNVHQDVIEFSKSEFANIAAVLADAHQVGANTVISYDAHDAVTLNNVAVHDLHAQNFHLV